MYAAGATRRDCSTSSQPPGAGSWESIDLPSELPSGDRQDIWKNWKAIMNLIGSFGSSFSRVGGLHSHFGRTVGEPAEAESIWIRQGAK
jgi:hypothetical protein